MIPLDGKPLLEYNIEWLSRHGVTEIIINLHHLPEAIRSYFGDGGKWGVRITYSLEDRPLGTAGGVKKASWFFDGPFFVWYGDNLSTCRINSLWAFHKAKGGVATVALCYREDPTESGIVASDENHRILRFLEKPRPDQVFSHWVSAGILVLELTVLDFISIDGSPDFGKDIFPALLAAGQPIFGYRMSRGEALWWIDTPEDLRRVKANWKEERQL
jgi:NDP-sugar pyrophosphorylase family protein